MLSYFLSRQTNQHSDPQMTLAVPGRGTRCRQPYLDLETDIFELEGVPEAEGGIEIV